MPLIVVIDDDAGTRMLVGQVLKKDGYDVLTAEDGVQGLALIREHKPDLVVSDVQMPKMNGYTFLLELNKLTEIKPIPIIVLTVKEGMSDLFKIEGAKEYITKPINLENLWTTIQKHIH